MKKRKEDIIIQSLNEILSFEDEQFLAHWYTESEDNRELYKKLERINLALQIQEGYDATTQEIIRKRLFDQIRREKHWKLRLRLISTGVAASLIIGLLSYVTTNKEFSNRANISQQAFQNNNTDTIFQDNEIVAYVKKVEVSTNTKPLLTTIDSSKKQITLIGEEKIIQNVVKVSKKSIYTIWLPDSTKVLLNGGSTLTYPSKFTGDSRNVELDGEAFFDVTKNPKLPFIIKTKDVESVVYGTRLNIEAYTHKNYISTTLFSGMVSVNGVVLKPGDRAVKQNGTSSIQVSDADLKSIDSWTRNDFYFNEVTLNEIAAELSHWYGVAFRFEDEKTPKELFTLICSRDKELITTLNLLSQTTKLNFKIIEGNVYVESVK